MQPARAISACQMDRIKMSLHFDKCIWSREWKIEWLGNGFNRKSISVDFDKCIWSREWKIEWLGNGFNRKSISVDK